MHIIEMIIDNVMFWILLIIMMVMIPITMVEINASQLKTQLALNNCAIEESK